MTRRDFSLKNSIAFVCVLVTVCSLFVLILSVLKLPDISVGNRQLGSYKPPRNPRISKNQEIGKFAEMMIEMLPEDLAFTAFVPSERAFQRDLGLKVNESLVAEKMNDTYAVVSRVLGFSVVPRTVFSEAVPVREGVSFESLSGFGLFVWKDSDGMLVVNRVRAERVDLMRGKIVVHVMDGVIMDAEFEQSVESDDNEEERI